jgi:DNA-binding NarL/FixJ family response regulator
LIEDGEIWAERRVVSQLLNELRGGINKPEVFEVVEKLTPREKDITRLVSEGMCQKSIANHLDISENTVRNHLRNIFDKTGVSSRLQLALLVKAG